MTTVRIHQPAPAISAGEIERRREALGRAIANNRIEGIEPNPATAHLFEAHVRGEITLDDLMAGIRKAHALR